MSKRKHNKLNDEFRNGGDIVESRESGGRDLISEMGFMAHRPDMLRNAMREMGIGENGDEPTDEELE